MVAGHGPVGVSGRAVKILNTWVERDVASGTVINDGVLTCRPWPFRFSDSCGDDLVPDAFNPNDVKIDRGEGDAVSLLGDNPNRGTGRKRCIAIRDLMRAIKNITQHANWKRGGAECD